MQSFSQPPTYSFSHLLRQMLQVSHLDLTTSFIFCSRSILLLRSLSSSCRSESTLVSSRSFLSSSSGRQRHTREWSASRCLRNLTKKSKEEETLLARASRVTIGHVTMQKKSIYYKGLMQECADVYFSSLASCGGIAKKKNTFSSVFTAPSKKC